MYGITKWETSLPKDPEERTFGGLQRNQEGKFKDDELVSLLGDAIEDCAGMSRQL